MSIISVKYMFHFPNAGVTFNTHVNQMLFFYCNVLE